MSENATYLNARDVKQAIADKFARVGALAAIGGTAIIGTASAALIDFSNISQIIQAVTGLIPDFMALVIAVAPLIVTIAIIGFVYNPRLIGSGLAE